MILEYKAETSELVVVRSHCSSILEWNENVSRVANQETERKKTLYVKKKSFITKKIILFYSS